MTVSSTNLRTSSSEKVSTRQAWARYVRNRFYGQKLLFRVMEEWGLTEGEARGVIYAQASQNTIDKIKQPPRGGWLVTLQVEAAVYGETAEQAIEKELAHVRQIYDEMDSGFGQIARNLRLVSDRRDRMGA